MPKFTQMKLRVIILPISLILTLFLVHGEICKAATIVTTGANLTEVESEKLLNRNNSEEDKSPCNDINMPCPLYGNNSQPNKPVCDGIICPK